MKMKSTGPTAAQVAFRHELFEVMKKHGDALSAEELLAVSAHLVGQILAMQDQRTMTPDMGMKLIGANIERGNHEAIEQLLGATGGNA